MKIDTKYRHNLELSLQVNQFGQTYCQHQYTTYPLRLSSAFRLEGLNSHRAYLYLVNTTPGLLGGDRLNTSLQLAANTNLYLSDQAATKVHQMLGDNKAVVENQIVIGENASLELVLEPIILYRDSVLEQNTKIQLHPTARLFLSEIVLPGRLAKQEYYDFRYFFNRLQITDLDHQLLFADAMRLTGTENNFKNDRLFTSLPIIGSAIAIMPDIEPQILIDAIDAIESKTINSIETATTVLPSENGILIRALATKTYHLKQYFTEILNQIRLITHQSPLPYIPK